MNATILLLPGDGIGPEVVGAAATVLRSVAAAFNHRFELSEDAIGGAALRRGLPPLPDATLKAAKDARAILLGAVGDPAFDSSPPAERPEAALLAIRKELGLYSNLRPARVWPGLEGAGPLKAEVLTGTDMLVVRELTGGLYYGEPRGISADGASAHNTMRYARYEIERIARRAFDSARGRRRHVTSVDKANVLETSRLWRTVVADVAAAYADVRLSDEAGAIVGSLGLLPSASLGDGPGLFEPVHGSAPDIAGKNIANPIGAIASAAMLLRHALGLEDEARAVERAIGQTLAAGLRTVDLAGGGPAVGTDQIAGHIAAAIKV